MKYIFLKNRDVLIFSETITHSTMARPEQVKSAGFIRKGEDGKMRCYGESVTLDKQADPADAEYIEILLTRGLY